MSGKMVMAAAGLILTSATILAPAAEARAFGRSASVQGSGGHGFTRYRNVDRRPGSTSVSRDFQTNSGAGMPTTRSANWSNGSYSGGATHTLNNGDTFGRSTTVTNNGNGTATYSTTHTGIDGQSTTVSGTVGHN